MREINNRINESNFKPYLYAIRTFDGPQSADRGLRVLAPFATVKDYDN